MFLIIDKRAGGIKSKLITLTGFKYLNDIEKQSFFSLAEHLLRTIKKYRNMSTYLNSYSSWRIESFGTHPNTLQCKYKTQPKFLEWF